MIDADPNKIKYAWNLKSSKEVKVPAPSPNAPENQSLVVPSMEF